MSPLRYTLSILNMVTTVRLARERAFSFIINKQSFIHDGHQNNEGDFGPA